MTEKTTPETFNFGDWFADANLPESSADIFTNAAVLSDLTDLQRRIDAEVKVEKIDERQLGEKRTTDLEDEYVALATKFTDSKITVYVRALTGTERVAIRAAHNEAKEADSEFIFRSLSAAIVGLKKASGERTPATLTVDQVRDLYGRVGDTQITAIYNAQLTATNALPTVDADFLRKLSGHASGQES